MPTKIELMHLAMTSLVMSSDLVELQLNKKNVYACTMVAGRAINKACNRECCQNIPLVNTPIQRTEVQ
jgi:hypothetical protein